MNPPPAPIGLVESLDSARDVHDRGFTFLGGAADGTDLVYSFAGLRQEAIKRAHHLRALGLTKGDRVAMVIPDGQEFIPTFLGALWAGLVPVPLYPPLALGKLDAFMEALTGILIASTPRVLVVGAKVKPLLWSVVGKVATLESIVDSSELGKPAPGADERPCPLEPGDLAFLQYTSGSTSAPKGVMVTHGSLAANCDTIAKLAVRTNASDVGVSWLPLYHDMGLIGHVLTPIIARVTSVFIPTLSFIKNATLWLETIHKYKGTLSFAPNFAYALVTKRARADQLARWDLSRMRIFGCGAEPINPGTMRAFADKFAQCGLKPEAITPCYGMAEATLAMSFVGLDQPLKTDAIDEASYHGEQTARPAAQGKAQLDVVSCGKVLPFHELSIQDDTGRRLAERVVGEICFKGPSVAAGYWQNPEATRAAGMGPEGNGWLRTGDLGYLAEGEIYISGRLKDILIVNGRNYYPQRIEWAVEEVAGVRKGSAVVFSRPGKSSEEVVVCAETRDPDREALRAAIVAKVNEDLQLAVADVRLVPPGVLPKTSSGKLQRRKTREQYLADKLGKEGVRTMGDMGQRLLVAKHLAFSLMGRARHSARGIVRRFLS